MAKQNYHHHSRYYPAHHYVFYPLLFVLFLIGTYGIFSYPESRLLWIVILCLVLLLCFLSLMMRQHYAMMNQNRIVRLELRFRYYVLTQRRFEVLEARLSQRQIFALRFAPDEELPALAERALQENLSPDAIKRAIKNWLPDHMRV